MLIVFSATYTQNTNVNVVARHGARRVVARSHHWQGRALAIVQPRGTLAGAISLRVTAPGLAAAQLVVMTTQDEAE